ncbi:hypothetical protein BRARA_D00605 [Brassica rapa]|uniref:Uncharacterized protein n=1 Tax=Brassica campestris TaxID=3711 RepID=A0A397ZPV5_BRACM|nr:hypothetical protein BRARA_D00605 [Brassica rapa]
MATSLMKKAVYFCSGRISVLQNLFIMGFHHFLYTHFTSPIWRNAQMASGASVEFHNTSETVRDSLFFPEPYLSLKAWTCKQTKRELCVFTLETHIFRSKSYKILVWTICY